VLAFTGPLASEGGMTDPGVEYRNPSTFADYRCDLIIHAMSSKSRDNNNRNITTASLDHATMAVQTAMLVSIHIPHSVLMYRMYQNSSKLNQRGVVDVDVVLLVLSLE
jgi:hypothetical protein